MIEELKIISCPARIIILRSLLFSKKGLSVRELTYRNSLGIRSVQLGLQFLIEKKLVRKTKRNNSVLYSIINNPFTLNLKAFLEDLERNSLKEKASHYSHKSSWMLSRMQDLTDFAQNLKTMN